MEKDFLVFFQRGGLERYPVEAQVLRIAHPPHDEPRGTILRDLVLDGLPYHTPVLHGVIELAPAAWSNGASRELTTADGRIGSLECVGNEWRVIL